MSTIKQYRTATREDLVVIAEKVADYILEHMRQGKPAPIINIYGSVSGGKSLIWDVVVQKILGNKALFIPRKSDSYQDKSNPEGVRAFETWVGKNAETGQGVQIFLCNVRATDKKLNAPIIDDLERGNFTNFGNVTILTNAPNGFFNNNQPVLNVAISTLPRTDFINPHWAREVTFH